jgi:hypothetical protein
MNSEKFQELKDNLDKEESRIRALKASIDPDQLSDLEATRGVLRFWEAQLKAMAWNTENEEMTKTLGFPASKRELLDKLQLKLLVFGDRIEVKGLFPIQPIDCQLLSPLKGTGGKRVGKYQG